MCIAGELWPGMSLTALVEKRIDQDDVVRQRFDECMSIHYICNPLEPPLTITLPITPLDDEDCMMHPVPTLDHPIKIVGQSVIHDFFALGLKGTLQVALAGPNGALCRLISSSHSSLFNQTYSYDWRGLFAKIVVGSFMQRHGLPFAQQMVAVLVHLMFGQAYAGFDGWTPFRRAVFHLVCCMYQPIVDLFINAKRCYPYHSKNSTAAKNAQAKSIMGSGTKTMYKHMFEELPPFFEKHKIPLRLLAECGIDQIQGRQQEIIRKRGGHSHSALEIAHDLLNCDTENQTVYGIRSTERGANNKRQRANSRKYGTVLVRPMVFDESISMLLSSQFSTMKNNLLEFDLEAFWHSFKLGGKTTCVLAAPDLIGVCHDIPTLKFAHAQGQIWFFCMCVGPGLHTAPCLLA